MRPLGSAWFKLDPDGRPESQTLSLPTPANVEEIAEDWYEVLWMEQ